MQLTLKGKKPISWRSIRFISWTNKITTKIIVNKHQFFNIIQEASKFVQRRRILRFNEMERRNFLHSAIQNSNKHNKEICIWIKYCQVAISGRRSFILGRNFVGYFHKYALWVSTTIPPRWLFPMSNFQTIRALYGPQTTYLMAYNGGNVTNIFVEFKCSVEFWQSLRRIWAGTRPLSDDEAAFNYTFGHSSFRWLTHKVFPFHIQSSTWV